MTRPSSTHCVCGRLRANCCNFRAYGYDCHGFGEGAKTIAPFGIKKSSDLAKYPVGPSFHRPSSYTVYDSDSD